MADNQIKSFLLRVPMELYQKFSYIAKYDGRSTTKQIEHMMKARVTAFEQKNGEIKLDEIE